MKKGKLKVGHVDVSQDPKNKMFWLAGLYPLGPSGKTKPEYSELEKHGIASFVREELVKDLIGKNTDYKIKDLANNEANKVWLRKRKIDPNKAYSLAEYLSKIQAYKKRKVWGVVVEPTADWMIGKLRRKSVEYKVHVVMKPRWTKDFFTYPALHEKIKEMRKGKLKGVKKIGRIKVDGWGNKNLFKIPSLYPYHPTIGGTEGFEELSNMGIASFAKEKLLEHLITSGLEYDIKSESPNKQARAHLTKIGIDWTRKYTLQEYLDKVREYRAKLRNK